MYSVFANNTRIYDDTLMLDDEHLIDPRLDLEDSAAGSFVMTVPVGNKGYGLIERIKTDITVVKDGTEIWWGRALSEEQNFYNDRVFTCEGALAFLNDVTQPLNQYTEITLRGYAEAVINVYNSRAAANRQFRIGAMPSYAMTIGNFTTNYEKTIECINRIAADRNLHIRITKTYGAFTGYNIDFLEDYPTTSSQVIQFGTNLLDFTRKWNSDEFATVIIPLGERLDESQYEGVDERLTVAEVNDGSIYVESQSVSTFGRIEKVVEFDGVTDPVQLLAMAQSYLSDIQFDDIELELSAVDLHYLDANYEGIKLLDKVRAVSSPHMMDRYFPVRRMSIPLDHPENTTFTLGDTQKVSLTGVNNQINRELIEAIKNIPPKTELLDAARANAAEIMNMATTGYITIHQTSDGTDALYISDTQDYTHATKYWKWSMNGLAYWKEGDENPTTAITMDGGIVGSFITAGSISADKLSSVYKDSVTNAISTLNNDINGLALTYSTNGDMAGILKLNRNGVQIGSDVGITMTGAVTFTDLSTSGRTTINGDNITTGTIKGRDIYLYQDDSLNGSKIFFEDSYGFPVGTLSLTTVSGATSGKQIWLRSIDTNTAIKIESSAGTSVVGDLIYEEGKHYITLQSGGYYDQSGSGGSWVAGTVNIGNQNTYTQTTDMQCRVNLWGDVYVNGSRIGTGTAVFG